MAFELITAQSNKPLKFAVNVGFAMSFVALLVLIAAIVQKSVFQEFKLDGLAFFVPSFLWVVSFCLQLESLDCTSAIFLLRLKIDLCM
mgnify:CR=1 FL=1